MQRDNRFVVKVTFPCYVMQLRPNLACLILPVSYTQLDVYKRQPFGIRFMFLLPVFFGNLGAGIAMTCFNIAIGALIGGFVLLWKLAVAVWYVPVTVVRLIRA